MLIFLLLWVAFGGFPPGDPSYNSHERLDAVPGAGSDAPLVLGPTSYRQLGCPMSPRVLSVKSHLRVLCGLWELGPFELLNLCLTPSLALFAHCVLLRLQAKVTGSTGVMARPGSGLPRLDSPPSAPPHTLRGPLESHSPLCVCDLAQN